MEVSTKSVKAPSVTGYQNITKKLWGAKFIPSLTHSAFRSMKLIQAGRNKNAFHEKLCSSTEDRREEASLCVVMVLVHTAMLKH